MVNKMNTELLKKFFSKEFELVINEKMMYRNYKFEILEVSSYVKKILEIDYDEFIQFAIDNYDVHYLTPDDVLQYSDFADATINICKIFKDSGDNGYRFIETGKMLQNDGISRNDMAYRKYGENHSKTSENLGLLQKIGFTYYLSCLGYILDLLTQEEAEKLVCRLILRNKLVRRLIYRSITSNNASYHAECGFLKIKTANRRKSNVRKLILKVENNSIKYKDTINHIEF